MTRFGFLVTMVVLLTLIGAVTQPVRTVHACSSDEEGWRQHILNAPVIAEGWVDSITLRPDLPNSPYIPVEVALRVERLVKGSAPDRMIFLDGGSVLPGQGGQPLRWPDGRLKFHGASGACGILDEDVTGKYGFMVFHEHEDGSLRTNRLVVAFGDGPTADAVVRLRQAVLAVGQPSSLPKTGNGGLLRDDQEQILLSAEAFAAIAALIALAIGKIFRNAVHE